MTHIKAQTTTECRPGAVIQAITSVRQATNILRRAVFTERAHFHPIAFQVIDLNKYNAFMALEQQIDISTRMFVGTPELTASLAAPHSRPSAVLP
jgi:hypothetical protein